MPRIIYDYWTEDEIKLFSNQLKLQRDRKTVDWNQILPHFPKRNKQQLVSYRNNHKDILYADHIPPSLVSQLEKRGKTSTIQSANQQIEVFHQIQSQSSQLTNNQQYYNNQQNHYQMTSCSQFQIQSQVTQSSQWQPFYSQQANKQLDLESQKIDMFQKMVFNHVQITMQREVEQLFITTMGDEYQLLVKAIGFYLSDKESYLLQMKLAYPEVDLIKVEVILNNFLNNEAQFFDLIMNGALVCHNYWPSQQVAIEYLRKMYFLYVFAQMLEGNTISAQNYLQAMVIEDVSKRLPYVKSDPITMLQFQHFRPLEHSIRCYQIYIREYGHDQEIDRWWGKVDTFSI